MVSTQQDQRGIRLVFVRVVGPYTYHSLCNCVMCSIMEDITLNSSSNCTISVGVCFVPSIFMRITTRSGGPCGRDYGGSTRCNGNYLFLFYFRCVWSRPCFHMVLGVVVGFNGGTAFGLFGNFLCDLSRLPHYAPTTRTHFTTPKCPGSNTHQGLRGTSCYRNASFPPGTFFHLRATADPPP